MTNYLRDKKILLLGGSGFVGKSIIKKLLESGARVIVISRQQNKVKVSNGPKFFFYLVQSITLKYLKKFQQS